MTREIKFRGKRLDNKEWVYGSVRTEESRAYILEPCYSVVVNEPDTPALGCGVEDGGWQKNGYTAAEYGWQECIERYANMLPVWVEVDPETVGQFTGLCDKNGKEVCEGDILRKSAYKSSTPFVIKSALGAFKLVSLAKHEDETYSQHFDQCHDDIEVIGNIHDNPDLLKEAK